MKDNQPYLPKLLLDKEEELSDYEVEDGLLKHLPFEIINKSILAIRGNSRTARNLFLIPWALGFVFLSYIFIGDFIDDKDKTEKSNLHFVEGQRERHGQDFFERPENKESKELFLLPLGYDLKLSYKEYLTNLRYRNKDFALKRQFGDIVELIFISILTPFLVIWAILFKRRALCYFDRERRCVYTWQKGKVYAQHFDKLSVKETSRGIDFVLCGENANTLDDWGSFHILPTGNIVHESKKGGEPIFAIILRFMNHGQQSVVEGDYLQRQGFFLFSDNPPIDLEEKITGILENISLTKAGYPDDHGALIDKNLILKNKQRMKTAWYRPGNLFKYTLIFGPILYALYSYRYELYSTVVTFNSPTGFEFVDNDKFVAFKGERCFLLGSFPTEDFGTGKEFIKPQCVGDFVIARHEVTQAEFSKFVAQTGYVAMRDSITRPCLERPERRENPQKWFTPEQQELNILSDHPVFCVSFKSVTEYIAWYNEQTDYQYRLPTEAEWEYAAKAGMYTSIRGGVGIEDKILCEFSNIADKNSPDESDIWYPKDCDDGFAYTAPVGTYSSNNFGLFDMEGNVQEWTCSQYSYRWDGSENVCSRPTKENLRMVVRGGSWRTGTWRVRVTTRNAILERASEAHIGFRLVRDL